MSWHVLHILTPEIKLSKYRGFLRCEQEYKALHQIPIEDLKCVVLATRGIVLTSEVIAALLEHKVAIVHCDSRYVPCGITMPMVQTINPITLERQVSAVTFKKKLWRKVLRQKIANQAAVLDLMGADISYVAKERDAKNPNESAAARQYFREYFRVLGHTTLTRRGDDNHQINIMLNYGYAVIQALIHRSLVAHGLNPLHGLHHADRYQAHALVYDMLEPWRPFLDLMLWVFVQKSPTGDFADFKKYIGFSQYGWQTLRFTFKNKSVKMINSIDMYSASLSNAFLCQKINQLWLPTVESSHYQDLLKWDGAL